MTKQQAIKLFGGTPGDLARGLGVTRQRIAQLPLRLTPREVDRVVGAALRLGLIKRRDDPKLPTRWFLRAHP
jgi:hypothetical protein